MKLLSQWSKHLVDKQAKANFESLVGNSTIVLNRLHDILMEEEQALLAEEASTSDYDSPSWAYKQAHRNGKRAALAHIKRLLK